MSVIERRRKCMFMHGWINAADKELKANKLVIFVDLFSVTIKPNAQGVLLKKHTLLMCFCGFGYILIYVICIAIFFRVALDND